MSAAHDAVALRVNGEPCTVPPGTTVADLLEQLDVDPRGVAVALGGDVVRRRAWADHLLADGDAVEILSVAQGG